MQDSFQVSLSVVPENVYSDTYVNLRYPFILPDQIKPKGRITRQYNPNQEILTSLAFLLGQLGIGID